MCQSNQTQTSLLWVLHSIAVKKRETTQVGIRMLILIAFLHVSQHCGIFRDSSIPIYAQAARPKTDQKQWKM